MWHAAGEVAGDQALAVERAGRARQLGCRLRGMAAECKIQPSPWARQFARRLILVHATMSIPPPSQATNQKPRLVVLSSSAQKGLRLDPMLIKFCSDFGFQILGQYQDGMLGELPVWAFTSRERKVNLRIFSLPGRPLPVVEFESAFATGECLVTTTAPVTGEAPDWVDLFGMDAAARVVDVAVEHGKRLGVAEARAGAEAVPIVDLAGHFELRGRAEFSYDLGNVVFEAKPNGGGGEDTVWYYSLAGERSGPVTFATLQGMARAGEFNASRDMAWMPEYAEWLRIREIPELAKLIPIAQPDSAATPMRVVGDSAEEIALDEPEEPFGDMIKARQDRGIGRIAFFILALVMIPGLAFGGHFAATRILADVNIANITALVILGLGYILATLGRLKNLAMSGAWILALAVPLLDLWVIYRLTVCPPGYAEHKRLGAGGVFLACFFWLPLAALAVLGVGLATGKIAQDIDPSKVPLGQEVDLYLTLRTMVAQIPIGTTNGKIRYDSGSAGWHSITYTYTVLDPKVVAPSVGGQSFEATMKPILTRNYSSGPNSKLLRDNNVTVNHRYLDSDGKLITTITIP